MSEIPLNELLSQDEMDIAIAIATVRRDYQRIRQQLTHALGREPTTSELLEAAPKHIEVLGQFHDILDDRRQAQANNIPPSMLVQIHVRNFLTKVRGVDILSSLSEKTPGDST